MKKFFLSMAGFLTLLLPALFALGEAEIYPTMQTSIGKVVAVLQDENMTKAERDASIERLTDPLFDYGVMAKLSLGKAAWSEMSSAQRNEYVTLFTRKIKSVYMGKLDLYSNEKIYLEKPVTVEKRIHLMSYIMSKGERREVLYKFYRSKARGWVIYDVDVLGVSIIQTYRSQFAGILKDGSIDDLLAQLKAPEA